MDFGTAEERIGYELVHSMGMDAAIQELNAIHEVAQRRMDELLKDCHPGDMPSGYTELNYMTDEQRVRRNRLSLGIELSRDKVQDARRALLARINTRRILAGRDPFSWDEFNKSR